MPYCSNCGSELDPNSSFCVSCGTPVAGSAASGPGPQPPPMAPQTPYTQPPIAPQTPYAQPGGYAPPPKGKGGKIALVTILALILIGAVVVLVLGFAVGPKWFVSSSSGGTSDNNTTTSGPEKTVDTFLKALENKDAQAVMATLSPSSISALESQMSGSGMTIENAIKTYLMTYQSIDFSGVKYSTQVTGDSATVTVVEGTVTTVDENGEKTTEDARDSSEPTDFNLTKINGSWLIDFPAGY
jgi:zinc-ribbon domain